MRPEDKCQNVRKNKFKMESEYTTGLLNQRHWRGEQGTSTKSGQITKQIRTGKMGADQSLFWKQDSVHWPA